MSRAPELAPPWLPRQQRRRFDRALRKLLRRETCSLCGNSFLHTSQTTSGLDVQGNVVLLGDCCISRVVVILGRGFFSARKYDFTWFSAEGHLLLNINLLPVPDNEAVAHAVYRSANP
jgi:hypothetical protein